MLAQIETLLKHITTSKAKTLIDSAEIINEELTVVVQAKNIVKFLTFLKTDKKCAFSMLMSICGADYPAREARFEIVYHLLSLSHNHRIRVKTPVKDSEFVPSSTEIFECANWYEREVYDMYGVLFSNHPDLRRILTDYGFEGYPLRKDFPLTGNLEVRYDFESKKVSYSPVNLTQEFRNFDFMSPWSGSENVLPGDEKATKD